MSGYRNRELNKWRTTNGGEGAVSKWGSSGRRREVKRLEVLGGGEGAETCMQDLERCGLNALPDCNGGVGSSHMPLVGKNADGAGRAL